MTRDQAIPYIGYVCDNALNGWRIGENRFSVVRPNSVLIGWQCVFEPMFVSVHSYLSDTDGNVDTIDPVEAEEIATDYLDEIGWFANDPVGADYVIVSTGGN